MVLLHNQINVNLLTIMFESMQISKIGCNFANASSTHTSSYFFFVLPVCMLLFVSLVSCQPQRLMGIKSNNMPLASLITNLEIIC